MNRRQLPLPPAPDRLWTELHTKIKPDRPVIVQFDQMVHRVWEFIAVNKLSIDKAVAYIKGSSYYGEFIGPIQDYFMKFEPIENIVNSFMVGYDSGSIG